MIRLTHKLLHEVASGNCGWNMAQLDLLGMEWPPQKGWLSGLIGKDISEDVWAKVVALRGTTRSQRSAILTGTPDLKKENRDRVEVALTHAEAQDLWVALDALYIARTIDMDKADAERWRRLRDKFKP